MAAYGLYTKPKGKAGIFISDTQYEDIKVDGPIQPIPRTINIDPQWANLGKALFNSKLLSGDGSISCASCHLIHFGGDDGFPLSIGVNNNTGHRNSPTVLNATFNFRQFWDGRSETLADQVAQPIHNPIEMNSNWPQIIQKLEKDPWFSKTFKQLSSKGITSETITKAITTFEETLITPDAPIDRFLLGDKDALTQQQQRGFKTFQDIGCITCHQGRNIGGNLYQKIGRINAVPEKLKDDLGLFTLTQEPEDRHVFKVPSLRNVAETAPYFHNGSVETLEEAVTIMAKAQLAITLSETDKSDLVAFLKSLSAPVYEFKGGARD